MLRLGGQTMGTDNAREFSSAAKGETLEDSIRIVGGYADVIVIRPQRGGSRKEGGLGQLGAHHQRRRRAGPAPDTSAARYLHHQGRAQSGRRHQVAMVGDLANGRTVRSLTYLLSKFKEIKIWFVAPPAVAMRDDLKAHLDEHRVPWVETEDLESVLPKSTWST